MYKYTFSCRFSFFPRYFFYFIAYNLLESLNLQQRKFRGFLKLELLLRKILKKCNISPKLTEDQSVHITSFTLLGTIIIYFCFVSFTVELWETGPEFNINILCITIFLYSGRGSVLLLLGFFLGGGGSYRK